MEDYYNVLGVTESATQDEIKKAYRNLVKENHPDKGGDEETFKCIKLAYEILSDPVRRKQYDITGETTTTKVRDEAISNIIQIILHVVPSFNADEDDLIKIAEDDARAMLDMVNKDISNTEIQIKHFEHLIDEDYKKYNKKKLP